MALALPPDIQTRLERTLDQSRWWQCEPPLEQRPEVIEHLSQGISNYSVLVGARERFVIRIDGVNPSAHGLNRQTEWRALQTASRAGIAPSPRYFNPQLGSLVCDYLPPDNSADPGPAAVGKLLRRIHALPARHHRLDLAERMLRYEKQIALRGLPLTAELRRCGNHISELLYDFSRCDRDNAVLCHNDLLRANRLYSGGQLWALDWEYCAMGCPWFDLAVVIYGDSLNTDDTQSLLVAYIDRHPEAHERERLAQFGCVYRYLELLWHLAQQRLDPYSDTVARTTAALGAMLEESTA